MSRALRLAAGLVRCETEQAWWGLDDEGVGVEAALSEKIEVPSEELGRLRGSQLS